ncbi:UDP-3-O-(3-hydroxymyristoyl)glucosamine N-acyltransferase [Geitlerinema sp. PCC 9228]|jgi:UDP-3-O-[3-hydroxymyristoyl] glucosamine N-acyltransferase|uniref:UDP-3-O-(3-hydroxymyristoyl)glucosamine N-acyltransferase n=1 Tax=Geitlerinema sp. PCC 9228 TaxID=111611 RepID=UPI0008F99C4B|nr:UDP-3-O-(3-hydroxymyristoyl)glucosamine N-acyltransferase [Geitlerinema sp. PCC 9228]
MKFQELVAQISDGNCPIHIADNPEIVGVAPIDSAPPQTLSYVEGEAFAEFLELTTASAAILPENEVLQQRATQRGLAWVATSQPRLLFARAIAIFYQPYQPQLGIHATATISSQAQLGQQVYVGANAVILEDTLIGDNVCVYPNVVIYPGVTIGDGTILHANCTIHERTQIGNNCTIHSNSVIGSEGFGFVRTESGWWKMEQSGYVVLEDGVEVGAGSTIDRPAVGETRVGQNTKIDNLVQVGHGCQLGANCILVSQVGLAGGVTVGNDVTLAGQVGVANRVKIGDGAIASAKTGIHQNIAPHQVVSGYPAIENQLWLKASAIYKRLPELYQTLRKIKRQLEAIVSSPSSSKKE